MSDVKLTHDGKAERIKKLIYKYKNFISGVTGDCDGPDEADMEPQHCTGYEIATHPVSTIVQCLDECLRLPHCDKFIFTGNGSESCKLLSTDGISTAFDARNLPQITGACAPTDMNVSKNFIPDDFESAFTMQHCLSLLNQRSGDPVRDLVRSVGVHQVQRIT